MTLQNQYANSPIIVIIIKTITIKFSVTVIFHRPVLKGFILFFQTKFEIKRNNYLLMARKIKESFVYRAVISYFTINIR